MRALSPRLKLAIVSLVIGVVLLFIVYLIDFPTSYGFRWGRIIVVTAIVLYALGIFIAQRMKKI